MTKNHASSAVIPLKPKAGLNGHPTFVVDEANCSPRRAVLLRITKWKCMRWMGRVEVAHLAARHPVCLAGNKGWVPHSSLLLA
jgi:hypothetical protein